MASCDLCNKGRQAGRHIRHQASGKWALRAPKKPDGGAPTSSENG